MNLKRDLIIALAIIGLSAGIFFAGVNLGLYRATRRAQASQAVSDISHGQAVAHAGAAARLEPKARAQAQTVAKAEVIVREAKQKLTSLPAIPQTTEAMNAVIAQQSIVIATQGNEIAALKLQVSIEHATALQWKQAYEDEAKALEAQRVVSKSYQEGMKEASWKSSFKGALTGLVVGYVAGRLQH